MPIAESPAAAHRLLPHAYLAAAGAATRRRLIEDAAQRLARAGAKVEDVTLPAEFERIEDAHRWVSSFEFARNFTWEIENHWDQISETLRNNRLKDGLACTFEQYRDARDLLARCRAAARGVRRITTCCSPRRRRARRRSGLNATGNAVALRDLDHHARAGVTLPLFTGPHGLPIGAQLIARRNNDRRLFAAARQVWNTLA